MKVVIVGGGLSGWITASYPASTIENLDVTIVSTDLVETIGVGESTTPTILILLNVLA